MCMLMMPSFMACALLCDPATTDEAEVISRLQRILYQSGPIRASDVGMRFELMLALHVLIDRWWSCVCVSCVCILSDRC